MLRLEDTGGPVLELQMALGALGFFPGQANGYFSEATEAAVKNFQTTYKLTVDGIVGPETRAALAAAGQPISDRDTSVTTAPIIPGSGPVTLAPIPSGLFGLQSWHVLVLAVLAVWLFTGGLSKSRS